jgi:threonine aldolase
MKSEVMKRGFGSDNHSGVHPEIFKALAEANVAHVPSYGTDPITLRATDAIRKHFGEKAESHFVFNGTAANVLALGSVMRSHHSVLASQHAHLINDECGAPEKLIGAKVISVASQDAKLTPEALATHLIRRGDQHFSQVRAISITQPTELGTVYSPEEIRRLADFAHQHQLLLHVDGARLVNAAASLGVGLREITTDCGVDIVSLGGTKNGMMFGEAVVFLRPGQSGDFKYVRKQWMQLPSKTRFIAAQFLALLGEGDSEGVWRKNALHANAMAKRLSEKLQRCPSVRITQKTQANAVFAILPKKWVGTLREQAFFYVWNEATFECRLMTSWDTEPGDIDGFIEKLEMLERDQGAFSS